MSNTKRDCKRCFVYMLLLTRRSPPSPPSAYVVFRNFLKFYGDFDWDNGVVRLKAGSPGSLGEALVDIAAKMQGGEGGERSEEASEATSEASRKRESCDIQLGAHHIFILNPFPSSLVRRVEGIGPQQIHDCVRVRYL